MKPLKRPLEFAETGLQFKQAEERNDNRHSYCQSSLSSYRYTRLNGEDAERAYQQAANKNMQKER